MATLANLAMTEIEAKTWMKSDLQIAVSTKRLSATMMWIFPSSCSDMQRLLQIDSLLPNGPIRRIEQRKEILGPNLEPTWVWNDDIPLQAWSLEVFQMLGSCQGFVFEVDEEAVCRNRLDVVHVHILRDNSVRIPRSFPLKA